MTEVMNWWVSASWSEAIAAVAGVVSGGSIVAFAVAMVRDGIKNGW